MALHLKRADFAAKRSKPGRSGNIVAAKWVARGAAAMPCSCAANHCLRRQLTHGALSPAHRFAVRVAASSPAVPAGAEESGLAPLPEPTSASPTAAASSKNRSGGSKRPSASSGGGGGDGGRGGGGGGGGGGGRGGSTGGPRTRGSAPSAVAAAAQAAADALFADPGSAPLEPRIGPVRVSELSGGRGWGLVTTRSVLPGELMLAVRPLALAWDEQYDRRADAADPPLEPSDAKFLELQRQLLGRRYSPREAAWLASMGGLPGGEEEEAQEAEAGSRLPPPPELEAGTQGGGEEQRRELPLPERLRDPDTLADMVQANCLEPDGAAEDEHAFWARREAAERAEGAAGASPSPAAARAEQRLGPMGLWPEAALLNHSCIPNTVAYVVGDTLFVRAARKVGGGSELTVSYLPVGGGAETTAGSSRATPREVEVGEEGDGADGAGDVYDDDRDDDDDDAAAAAVSEPAATLLSPLAERRAALEELRGFFCRCSRCRAEESLDPKLRALMADVTAGASALKGDLESALALAALDEDGDLGGEEVVEGEEEDEGEDERPQVSSQQKQEQGGRGQVSGREGGENEEEEDEGEEEGSRWRELVGSVVDRAGLYLELMDAAMVKLKLTPAQQMTAQSAVTPLYTLLWAAMGSRGELEPRLAEVVAALVGEVAPGSADHLWWAALARETAEMIVAEEEALTGGALVRRGGSGGGGFRRRDDERVMIADKGCYKAFGIRYGPISRGVYRGLLEARRLREDLGQ